MIKSEGTYSLLYIMLLNINNLALIKLLIYTYEADVTIENKDGHDPIEYLHFGEVSTSNFLFNLNF